MFSRFAAAVLLIVAIALLGIALEKRNLELRRSISLQVYRLEQLEEQLARVRLRLQHKSTTDLPDFAEQALAPVQRVR